MTGVIRTLNNGPGSQALKAAAFDLSPEPAMVVDAEGALVAVNEAAEALFGQGLALLARGRFRAALPEGSALISLLNRALEEGARVREHGVEISLFGHPAFTADGAAAPLGDGSVLLTLHVRVGEGLHAQRPAPHMQGQQHRAVAERRGCPIRLEGRQAEEADLDSALPDPGPLLQRPVQQ